MCLSFPHFKPRLVAMAVHFACGVRSLHSSEHLSGGGVQAKGASTVAVTCTVKNSMQRAAHSNIHLPLQRELCPFDLAPVTSTAVQMLFGDTLAVAVMQAKSVSRSVRTPVLLHPCSHCDTPFGIARC
jgi:hypothetical protein